MESATERRLAKLEELERRESDGLRKAAHIAWGSVALAASVFALLVLGASWQLADLERRRTALEARIATARAEMDALAPKLEELKAQQLTPEGRAALLSAEDDLAAARAAAGTEERPSPGSRSGPRPRSALVADLFARTAATRKGAYEQLMASSRSDESLVPELLDYARTHADNDNGTYNTLVVLSHIDRSSLRAHKAAIASYAESVKPQGPRIAARAAKVLDRLPD
jgi:hypothetical protein